MAKHASRGFASYPPYIINAIAVTSALCTMPTCKDAQCAPAEMHNQCPTVEMHNAHLQRYTMRPVEMHNAHL